MSQLRETPDRDHPDARDDAFRREVSKVLSTEVFTKYIFASQEIPQSSEKKEKNKYFSLCETLPTLKASAEALIDEALNRSGHNQKIAAAMLGITPPALSKRLKQDFSHFGLGLSQLYITSINPPTEVQKTIDDKSRLGVINDLDRLVKLKAAAAIEKASESTGEGIDGSNV